MSNDEFDPIILTTIISGDKHANPLPQVPEGWRLRRVWTVMDEEKIRKIGLRHNESAFLEDVVHDYQVRNGCLHYYSRVAQTGIPVEVALEYEPEIELKKRQSARLARMKSS